MGITPAALHTIVKIEKYWNRKKKMILAGSYRDACRPFRAGNLTEILSFAQKTDWIVQNSLFISQN